MTPAETTSRDGRDNESQQPRLCFLVNDAGFFRSHRLPLAIAAARAGFEVHIGCPPSPACETLLQHGFQLHSLPVSRGASSPLAFFRLVQSYYRLLAATRPAVVHLITAKPIILGGIVARLLRIPSLSAISGLGFLFTHNTWRIAIIRALAVLGYRLAIGHPRNHAIFQNQDDLAEFKRRKLLSRATYSLIRGSGVDLCRFRAVEEPAEPVIVLLPARMLRDKGVVEFVEAARLLRARGSRARFHLQGQIDPGNPTAVDAIEIARWEAEGVISWFPHTDAIEDVLQQVHVVAFPSYREGLPKTIIDAAAAGRPTVTTDVPGCRDAIVSGETGLLARVADPHDLADKIEALVSDRPARVQMGKAARAFAERNFDIRAVVSQHLRLYATLAAGSESSR